MQYLSPEQADKIAKAWRDTPYDPEGTPVTIIYRTEPRLHDAFVSSQTMILIGGHAISLVDYMAVEIGAAPRPYVLLVQLGGFALRLPLGGIRVEPVGVDHTAEIAESEKLPVPPEWTAWQAAIHERVFPPVARSSATPTTKVSDWNRTTKALEEQAQLDATTAPPTLPSP